MPDTNIGQLKMKIIVKLYKILMVLLILCVICVVGYFVGDYIRPDYYIMAEVSEWEFDANGGEVKIDFNTNIPENELHLNSSPWIEVQKESNCIFVKCLQNDESGDNEEHKREGYINLYCYDKGFLGLGYEHVGEYISIYQKEDSTKTCGGIDKVWFTTNEEGIRIHVDFEVRYVDVLNCKKFSCVAWVYDENGKPVISDDNNYTNNDSHVCVSKSFYPDCGFKKYKNFKLFIPYEAFAHSSLKNRTELCFKIALKELLNGKWRQFAQESDIEFEFPNIEGDHTDASDEQEVNSDNGYNDMGPIDCYLFAEGMEKLSHNSNYHLFVKTNLSDDFYYIGYHKHDKDMKPVTKGSWIKCGEHFNGRVEYGSGKLYMNISAWSSNNPSGRDDESDDYPQPESPFTGSDVGIINNSEESGYKPPVLHRVTREVDCPHCQGGYNTVQYYGGNNQILTRQQRCVFCRGSGTLTENDYEYE